MGIDLSFGMELFPKELKLLLFLINTEDLESALLEHEDIFQNVDWQLFLQLARHHRVYPITYLRIKRLDETLIPKHVVETLKKDYYKNTFQMLFLSSEMERISKLFAENGIRILLLKGPILAADLYGDISLRTSVDLDILVSLSDLNQVEKFLLDLGYIKHDFFSTVLDEWKWRIHHLDFVHPKTGINLEIHWRLNPGPGKEPTFDELWERKRVSSVTNHPVYYLDKEDLFLFLVTHGARHGWSKLGWLVDIDKLVKQKPDLNRLCRLLKKHQCLHIAGQALILSSQLLNTEIMQETEKLEIGSRSQKLAHQALFYIKQMVNLHTDPVPEDVSRYHKRHLFALMSSQQKLIFLMSCFYPYPMDAEILPLPKFLHFLYVPLRPILWAWRKTKKCGVF